MRADTVIESLGDALLQSVWAGALAAVFYAAVLIFVKGANSRYAAGCIALAAIPCYAAFVFVDGLEWKQALVAEVAEAPDFAVVEEVIPKEAKTLETTADRPGEPPVIAEASRNRMAVVVAIWAIGVFMLSVRLGIRWAATNRLRRRGIQAAGGDIETLVTNLAARMGVTKPVRVLRSTLVCVPSVAGWLKPVILLPAASLAGLRSEDLEAILAHELAHIRRSDYLVSLLQNLVETLFFFHPAVWWISRSVRIEREHCCDDIAAGTTGNVLSYVRALAALEDLRGDSEALSLAASGRGGLLARIRRLTGAGDEKRARRVPLIPAFLVAVAVCVPFALSQSHKPIEKEAAGRVIKLVDGGSGDPVTGVEVNVRVYSAAGDEQPEVEHFSLTPDENGEIQIESRIVEDFGNEETRSWIGFEVRSDVWVISGRGSDSIPERIAFWKGEKAGLTLLRPDGKPAGDANVLVSLTVNSEEWEERFERRRWSMRLKANEAGAFSLAVPPLEACEELTFHCSMDGGAPMRVGLKSGAIFNEDPEIVTNGSTVQFEEGGTLSGIVLDSAGQPLANAEVSVYDPSHAMQKDVTGEDGRFRIPHLSTKTRGWLKVKAGEENGLPRCLFVDQGFRWDRGAKEMTRTIEALPHRDLLFGVKGRMSGGFLLEGQLSGKTWKAEGVYRKESGEAGLITVRVPVELKDVSLSHKAETDSLNLPAYRDSAGTRCLDEIPLGDANSVRPGVIEFVRGYRVTFEVKDSKGGPVPDARINCSSVSEYDSRILGKADYTGGGEYRTGLLFPGTSLAYAAERKGVPNLEAKGAVEVNDDVTVELKLMPANENASTGFRDWSAMIVDGETGKPLEGVAVKLVLESESATAREVTVSSGGDGIIRLGRLADEKVSVAEKAGAWLFVSNRVKVDRGLAAPPVTQRITAWKTVRVRGTLLGLDGKPARDLEVFAKGKLVSLPDGWVNSVKTDRDGVFQFEVPAAPVHGGVELSCATGVAVPWSKRLREVSEMDLGEIRLKKGVNVRGKVESNEGEPLAGVFIQAGNRAAVSGADGGFEFGALEFGEITFEVPGDTAGVFGRHSLTARPGQEFVATTIRAVPCVELAFEMIHRTPPAERGFDNYKRNQVRLSGTSQGSVRWVQPESRRNDGKEFVVFTVPAALDHLQLHLEGTVLYTDDRGVVHLPGSVSLGSPEKCEPGKVEILESASLIVELVDATGAPVNHADLDGFGISDRGIRNLGKAQSRGNGRFLFGGIFPDESLKVEVAATVHNRFEKIVKEFPIIEGLRATHRIVLGEKAYASERKRLLRSSLRLLVNDAESGAPVTGFRVIAGTQSGAGVVWHPDSIVETKRSEEFWPLDKVTEGMQLRIEADGYVPSVSSLVAEKDRAVDLIFELVRDKGVKVRILLPDGAPGEFSKVALASAWRSTVLEGRRIRGMYAKEPESLRDRWMRPFFATANSKGMVVLPQEIDPTATVLAVHEKGVRRVSFASILSTKEIQLKPWEQRTE